MRLMIFRVLIISCIISTFSLAQAERTRPIFGKYIDRDLSAILKIITMTLDRRPATNPARAMEIDLKIDSAMRMIKQYLTEEKDVSEISSRRSRRFFFWPLYPWFLGKQVSTEGGMRGSIYGGFGPDGFHIGGGVDGGLMAHWKSH